MGVASPAQAAKPIDTSALREAVTIDGVRAHQRALQDVADFNGGERVSGTLGYLDSVDYVAGQLLGAGYDVRVQEFPFPFFEEFSTPILDQVSPNAVAYPANDPDGFFTMTFSGSGDATAMLAPVDIILPPGARANTSTSGCEAEDFDGFLSGSIALVQRGSCTFALKARNAEAAGAVGIVIFNEGQPGRTGAINGTLSRPGVNIPVIGASFAIGQELYDATQSGAVVVRLAVDAGTRFIFTQNVIAETPGGRDDRVVVVGAHLDSVPGGPGINDNGSGSAAILETAIQMSALGIEPRNKVRFAFWGGEEFGLHGSQFYVDNLSAREIRNIALNLNFDMLGSPNFVRFVYDGDDSDIDPDTDTAGPNGSGHIEQVFLDYFRGQDLPVEPTEFSGRSDYGPFIAIGIPAGGLFSGAEGAKTEAQAVIYGGTAGVSYDPCYHLACDTFENVAETVLDQFSDAVAHSTLTFAETTSAVSGTDRANGRSTAMSLDSMEYLGGRAQR